MFGRREKRTYSELRLLNISPTLITMFAPLLYTQCNVLTQQTLPFSQQFITVLLHYTLQYCRELVRCNCNQELRSNFGISCLFRCSQVRLRCKKDKRSVFLVVWSSSLSRNLVDISLIWGYYDCTQGLQTILSLLCLNIVNKPFMWGLFGICNWLSSIIKK